MEKNNFDKIIDSFKIIKKIESKLELLLNCLIQSNIDKENNLIIYCYKKENPIIVDIFVDFDTKIVKVSNYQNIKLFNNSNDLREKIHELLFQKNETT